MLQDQSRNRTPMPGAQAPAATSPDTGPARAEAGIAAMLASEAPLVLPAQMLIELDPIFAAIRECERLEAVCTAEYAKGNDGNSTPEQSDAAAAVWGHVTGPLSRTVPTTAAGCVALARFIPSLFARWGASLDGEQAHALFRLIERSPACASPDLVPMAAAELPAFGPPEDSDAVDLAIEAHRSARAALTAACNPADSVWVEQNGGDTSDEAMAPARAIYEVASDAETDAWDALLEVRPSDPDGLLRMLRYLAGAGPMEVLGDAREFGRNIAEAAEAALRPAIDADAELMALGRQFDRLHAAWLVAVEAAREPGERFDAFMEAAKARGGPTMKDIEAVWALPGVKETHDAEETAFAALSRLGDDILQRPARTVQGLAVQARVTIPQVWPGGTFEADAALAPDEDVDKETVRALIESCCALAGVDWRGQPQRQSSEALPTQAVLADLLRQLEECDKSKSALTPEEYDTPRDEELYRQHWDLREEIDEFPTVSFQCLQVKARTALFALKWDPDAENEGAGSFVSLAKQVVTGIGERPLVGAAESSSITDQILAAWRAWGARPDLDESEAGQAEFDRLSNMRNALIDAAEALPATLENALSKALASAWLDYVQLWSHGKAREDYGSDGRLALDIDTAICGRLKTGYAGVAA